MTPKSHLLRVRVKFKDPDALGAHFETSEYLYGSVIAVVPGPYELNWMLRLDEPINCYDVYGHKHTHSDFFLKPNGMDAEYCMGQLLYGVPDYDDIIAMAMLFEEENIPKRIDNVKEYCRFAMISDVRILFNTKSNR